MSPWKKLPNGKYLTECDDCGHEFEAWAMLSICWVCSAEERAKIDAEHAAERSRGA